MKSPLYLIVVWGLIFISAANRPVIGKDSDEKPAEAKAAPAEQLHLNIALAPLQAFLTATLNAKVFDVLQDTDNAEPDDAMLNQILAQLRPMQMEELEFLRLICPDLTERQRQQIRVGVESKMRKVAKSVLERQNRANRAVLERSKEKSEIQEIRDVINIVFAEVASDDQQFRFQEELAKRIEDRNQAGVLRMVSQLDDQLFLNREQRAKISEALLTDWPNGLEEWLTISNVFGSHHFPMLPDSCVLPFLNSEQKAVWQGIQKQDFGMWFGQNALNIDEDGWWGTELEAEKPAEQKSIFTTKFLELFR